MSAARRLHHILLALICGYKLWNSDALSGNDTTQQSVISVRVILLNKQEEQNINGIRKNFSSANQSHRENDKTNSSYKHGTRRPWLLRSYITIYKSCVACLWCPKAPGHSSWTAVWVSKFLVRMDRNSTSGTEGSDRDKHLCPDEARLLSTADEVS